MIFKLEKLKSKEWGLIYSMPLLSIPIGIRLERVKLLQRLELVLVWNTYVFYYYQLLAYSEYQNSSYFLVDLIKWIFYNSTQSLYYMHENVMTTHCSKLYGKHDTSEHSLINMRENKMITDRCNSLAYYISTIY